MKKSTLLVLAAVATPLAAQNPRPSVLVDNPPVGVSVAPNVASSGTLSVITYSDTGVNEVYATASDENGLVWGPPVRVDRDTTASSKFVGFQEGNETVHIHRNHVYITWRDDRNGAFDDVYFNRSIDSGVTYASADQRISTVSAPGISSVRDWSMSVSRDPGGNPTLDKIYVLMGIEVTSGGPEDLFLTVSMDGGATFGPSIPVSTANGTGADHDDISVCSDGLNVYMTWVDDRSGSDDQWVRVSNDGGATFGPEIVVNSTPGTGNTGGTCDINCDATGKVVVIFDDILAGQGELWAAASPDFGLTWGPAVRVGNYAPGIDDTDNGQVAISGPNLVATWEDNRTGSDEIYATHSPDMGLTWAPDVAISAGGGGFPRLSKDHFQNVVITWTGNGFPEDSLGAYSLDAGVTFTPLVAPISDTTGDTDFTELAYNPLNQNIIACWLSDDTGGNRVYAGGFSLCSMATTTFRNGGTNPAAYTATTSVLGGTWTGTVDATITGHSLTAIVGFFSPLTLTLGGGQTLLVNIADPGGEVFGFAPMAGPVATYSVAVPNDPSLCRLAIFSQGVLVGGVTPFALTNAQDIVVGAY